MSLWHCTFLYVSTRKCIINIKKSCTTETEKQHRLHKLYLLKRSKNRPETCIRYAKFFLQPCVPSGGWMAFC